MTGKAQLKKGATAADILDQIEAATVQYMSAKRGLTEQAFRLLLTTCAETRASYERKNARAKQHLIAMGLSAKVFA